jgi:hypothetical protein
VPALRKPNENTNFETGLEAFERMARPRPLPPHFGEIDVAAPFDPHRHFTMLRCTGANPYLWRYGDQGVQEVRGLHGATDLQKRRFYEANAWANAQDRDGSKLKSYLRAIVATKPDGDFIHYLGC